MPLIATLANFSSYARGFCSGFGPFEFFDILLVGAGGGPGGYDASGVPASAGAGAGVSATFRLPIGESIFFSVGARGGQGADSASGAAGGAGGTSSSVYDGGAGGAAGTSGSSGGGGGGGAGTAAFLGTSVSGTLLMVAGGGGGGGGQKTDFTADNGPDNVGGGGGGNQTIGTPSTPDDKSGINGTNFNGLGGKGGAGRDIGGGGGGGGGYYGGNGQLGYSGFEITPPGNPYTRWFGSSGGGNWVSGLLKNAVITQGNDGAGRDSSGTGATTIPNASNWNYSNNYGEGGFANTNGINGIAIIRYFGTTTRATGGTITTSGQYTVHTFTADGTFTRTA